MRYLPELAERADVLAPLPQRMFSVESPKAIKAEKYGYLNGILYMAPAATAGVGNLCPHASPGCLALCLGWHSGQASMVKRDEDLNNVRRSRILKAKWFMRDRQEFLANVARDIARLIKRAKKKGRKLCIRLNGATDIAYEGLRLTVSVDLARALSKLSGTRIKPRESVTLFELFPKTQFVDYTKNAARMLRDLPRNYHLTFSRSETNEEQCKQVLAAGKTVAAVFRGSLPKRYLDARVIDGDKHDLRHKDPRGVVVGLLPKGLKAKRDTSGFVINNEVTQ